MRRGMRGTEVGETACEGEGNVPGKVMTGKGDAEERKRGWRRIGADDGGKGHAD